jgi:hypothetical protein
MRQINLVQRLTIAAAFIAFALFTTACGPDCDGICNDGFEVCARAEECDDTSQAIVEVQIGCALAGSVAVCTAACEESPGEEKDEAREEIDQALADLAGFDC